MDLQRVNQQWSMVRAGMNRVRPWFDLCRLPQSLLVASDPLAGALIAGAAPSQIPQVLVLMLAVTFLHGGAAALNDWHDYKSDRVERPDRPMPAGRVGRWTGLVIGLVLLCFGWALASAPSLQSGQIGVVLLSSILVHEFLMKAAPAARFIPGAARALALLLGMMLVSPGASSVQWPLRVFFMSVLAIYVLGAMILACRVADEDCFSFTLGGAIVSGLAAAALGLTRLFFGPQTPYPVAEAWLGLLFIVAGIPVLKTLVRPGFAELQAAAWSALLGSVLINAAAVAFTRGMAESILVAAVLAPVVVARRWLVPSAPGLSLTGKPADSYSECTGARP